MTDAELDRLAALVADALLRARVASPATGGAAAPWLPTPVRPALSVRGGEPPVWSAAAQGLGDTARTPGAEARRVTAAELTNATRAAAAGRGVAPVVAPTGRMTHARRARVRAGAAIEVTIGISNRHLHLSTAHMQALFGAPAPTPKRELAQPGQFAAHEVVEVVGPKGRRMGVRVVGPTRGETQLELAHSDAQVLGVEPPLAASGSLADSSGGVTLAGPAGNVVLERGVIVAARHLHLSPADAAAWGLADGDRLDVRAGAGARAVTFHDVLVRSGPTNATELHLDVDEARAAGVHTGDRASVIAWRAGAPRGGRRTLLTERDVTALASRGGVLPPNALLTPSARDRARAAGLLRE